MWTELADGHWEHEYPNGDYGFVSNGTIIAMWSLSGSEGKSLTSGHVTLRGRMQWDMRHEAMKLVDTLWAEADRTN
jgi:hypothetical protein